MKRREFITLLGGAAAAGRSRRGRRRASGCGASECSSHSPRTIKKVRSALQRSHRVCREFGWIIGRNVRIDTRWAAGEAERIRRYAAELVALAPDVILVVGAPSTGALLQATRTTPIVFVNTLDPVGAGFIDSLARPAGNATGFTTFRIRYQRQMAGVAQGHRAARDARSGTAEYRRWPQARWAIGGLDSGRRTVFRSGVASG